MRLQVGLEVLASNPRVVGLPGLGLKTRGMISGARDVIRELVSRRSDFMKGSRSDVWKSVWTISPQLLSGSSLNLGALLELCNSHVDKYSGCPGQTSLPPQSYLLRLAKCFL